ncbi:MAG: hypothetical protein ACLTDR_15970 [Adlercreutzia equolifaciens]
MQFDVGQEFDEDREHLPRFNPTEAYEGSPRLGQVQAHPAVRAPALPRALHVVG